MKKRVLVTGGAGFIGSHLCARLLDDGNEVICVDNLFTGSFDNIIHLVDDPSFNFIEHDITKELKIKCEQIYNLACPASPKYYQKDPIKTAMTIVYGSINMLELAKENNAKILQASTSEIYGDPLIHPQIEKYWGNVNPIGIRSCYDEGKRIAETFFMDYHRQYDLDVKIMRIFNTYGAHMSIDDGRVISNFITQALRNEDITIYGSGKQTRSFCYVDDLISAMIKLMDTNKAFTGPINIGNPEEIDIYRLALKIIDLTDSKSNIIFCDLPKDDPMRRKPNIELAQQLLAWQPTVDLDTGLLKTINYFKRICVGQ